MDAKARTMWERSSPQTTLEEVEELYAAILKAPDGDVLEVGSAAGGTTVVLIGAAVESRRKVISVDPYPEELEGVASHYKKGVVKSLRDGFVKNTKGLPVTQYLRNLAGCHWLLPKLAVVFIDSCHELSMVKEEFEIVLPLVVSGGSIYIHDTDWRVGQLSGKHEEGLCNFGLWVDKELFSYVGKVGSMWKGVKK